MRVGDSTQPTAVGARTVAGFTYIGLLIAIAILGIALTAAAEVWRTVSQRDRETQLLYVGDAYRRAIASYYRAGAQLPHELADLVQDERTFEVRRHLRRLYPDPMTGQLDWEVIRAPDGGIVGVRSTSQKAPIKRANFPPRYAAFADAQCYCDWMFVFSIGRGAHGRSLTGS
jgi:type II secretory pathway pseudopilin PulG